MEQIITKEDRKIYHQLLDNYLDEPESVRKVGSRMIQFVKPELDFDNEQLTRPKKGIKGTTYQMIINIDKKQNF